MLGEVMEAAASNGMSSNRLCSRVSREHFMPCENSKNKTIHFDRCQNMQRAAVNGFLAMQIIGLTFAVTAAFR